MLSQKDGAAVVREVLDGGIITSTDIVNIGYRKRPLQIFKESLADEAKIVSYAQQHGLNSSRIEVCWQNFFQKNEWIFGFGLDYRFLSILQREARLSSPDVAGRDTVIGDFLLGDDKFTVLVELKKASTPLFAKKNRSNTWSLSSDLIDAVSQILEQKASWQVKAEANACMNFNDGGGVIHQRALDPKAILVIGNSSEFSGQDKEQQIKARTFELFRRDSRNIDIITYDELYRRAQFIVTNDAKKTLT